MASIDFTGKHILVTGGAGFIGSNLVDALISQGNTVTVLDDFSTGKPDNLAKAEATGQLTLIEGSILDTTLVKRLVQDVDIIFHLAVQCLRVCFDRPHHVHEVNATGTLNLLESVRVLNPKLERFIYVSSSEIYGTAKQTPMSESHLLLPTTTYGASKLAGELYTKAYHTTYNLPVTILRPFNTYGYREHYEGASGEVIPRFIVNILNDKPPVIFGDGKQTRDFTFVTDTVEGLIRAAGEEQFIGEAVNIAYGEEVSIKEIAERLLKALGREDLSISYQADRPGDVYRHYADVTKLQQTTGYKPSISIEEGLKLYIDWFKANYPNPEKLLDECQLENWKLSDAQKQTPSVPAGG